MEFFLSTARSLKQWTWAEALEAIALLDGNAAQAEAIDLIQDLIFTPTNIYSRGFESAANRKLDEASSPRIRNQFVRRFARDNVRSRVAIAVAAATLFTAGVKARNEYYRADRVAAREQWAASRRVLLEQQQAERDAIEMKANLEDHRRGLQLIAEAAVPWKEAQARYLQTKNLESWVELVRSADSPAAREELAIRGK